jgi:hypothetical protein
MQISSSSSRRSAASKSSGSSRLTCVFDPLPGIDPVPITVRIAGRVYTAPARTAGDWFTVLKRAGWLSRWRIIPDSEHDPRGIGAAAVMAVCLDGDPGGAYRLRVAIDDGDVSASAVADAGRRLFAKAAGAPWWVAERVAIQSVAWTGVGAELYMKGMRPDVPLPVWLGAAYRTWMSLLDDKARKAADDALSLPPSGYDSDEPLPASLEELFV